MIGGRRVMLPGIMVPGMMGSPLMGLGDMIQTPECEHLSGIDL